MEHYQNRSSRWPSQIYKVTPVTGEARANHYDSSSVLNEVHCSNLKATCTSYYSLVRKKKWHYRVELCSDRVGCLSLIFDRHHDKVTRLYMSITGI